jgi:hypothetical protein
MSITRIPTIAAIAALSAFFSARPSQTSAIGRELSNVTTTDSLERALQQALARLSTPELEERKHLLRSFQRKGYASTLAEVLRGDGISALASYLRTRLQIEYSISHEVVMVDISARDGQPARTDSLNHFLRSKPTIVFPAKPREPLLWGFDIDWTFPENPWKRE